jgi:hypothetical protein
LVFIGPSHNRVAVAWVGTDFGISGVDVCHDGILVVAELGDGPLVDDNGFALRFIPKQISTHLYVFRLRVITGSELRSLVGIFESGVIATGNVRYNVGSALEGAGYRAHVANML